MRHASSHTIEGKLRQDIDTTIDALEARIRDEHESISKRSGGSPRHNDSSARPPTTRISSQHSQGEETKRRMIWISVGCIGAMILVMWGWHMRTVLYDVSRGVYDVQTPLHRAGTTFEEAMLIAGANDAQAQEAGFVTTPSGDLSQSLKPSTSTAPLPPPPSEQDPAFTALLETLDSYPTSTVSSTASTPSTSSTRPL